MFRWTDIVSCLFWGQPADALDTSTFGQMMGMLPSRIAVKQLASPDSPGGDDTVEKLHGELEDAPEGVVPPVLAGVRVGSEAVARLNAALAHYRGTRNYHNFTSGKKAEDDAAKRHMVSFTAEVWS